MPDPTLSEVHADLVGRLEQDKRLRAVEQQQSAIGATMQALLSAVASDRDEQRESARLMEQRLTAAIQDAKPKNGWVAAGVIVASLAVVASIIVAIALQR